MKKHLLRLVVFVTWCVLTATIGAREAGSCSLAAYREAGTVALTEGNLDAPVASTPVLVESDGAGGGCGGGDTCGGGDWAEFDVEALGLDRLAVRSADGEVSLYRPAGREPDGRTYRIALLPWELPSSRQIDIATVTTDDERGAWASVTLPEALFR